MLKDILLRIRYILYCIIVILLSLLLKMYELKRL